MSQRPATPRQSTGRRREKGLKTRQALLDAAARVVGRDGYAGATIARVAAEAGVSSGTIYNYFDSQHAMFDELLPAQGAALQAHIKAAVAAAARDPLSTEEARFRAFFEYLVIHPEYQRIMIEAQTVSRVAFKKHQFEVSQDFLRALQRARSNGFLPHFNDLELEAVVYMLMGIRPYLAERFTWTAEGAAPLPDWLANVYRKFIGPALLQTSSPASQEIAARVILSQENEVTLEAWPTHGEERLETANKLFELSFQTVLRKPEARQVMSSMVQLATADWPSRIIVRAKVQHTSAEFSLASFQLTGGDEAGKLVAWGERAFVSGAEMSGAN